MEPRKMKEVVDQFVEKFWNEGDFESARELLTNDVIVHAPADGMEGLQGLASTLRAALPDWHSSVEEMVVEGDTVVERWTARGTHKGELFGSAATGRRVEIPGVVFYRFRGGKIAEFRGFPDQYALMQQLGLLPDSAGTSL